VPFLSLGKIFEKDLGCFVAEGHSGPDYLGRFCNITLSLRAFLRIKLNGTIWYESKPSAIREPDRTHLANPPMTLAPSA
jgi:hypothetical protein